MNDYVKEFPDAKKYINLPLTDMFVCPNIYPSPFDVQLRYIYRFIYNICCKKQKPLNEKEDLLIQASKELFSGNRVARETRSTKKTGKGEGGHGSSVLIQYLFGSKSNFAILVSTDDLIREGLIEEEHIKNRLRGAEEREERLAKLNTFKLYKPKPELAEILQKINFESRFQRINLISIFNGLEEISISKANEFDIILFDTMHEPFNNKNIQIVLENNFQPESCNIHLEFLMGSSHATCGFICDEIPKVYDSAVNVMVEIDWINNPNFSGEYINSFGPYWDMGRQNRLESAKIMSVIYINKSVKERFGDQKCIAL